MDNALHTNRFCMPPNAYVYFMPKERRTGQKEMHFLHRRLSLHRHTKCIFLNQKSQNHIGHQGRPPPPLLPLSTADTVDDEEPLVSV